MFLVKKYTHQTGCLFLNEQYNANAARSLLSRSLAHPDAMFRILRHPEAMFRILRHPEGTVCCVFAAKAWIRKPVLDLLVNKSLFVQGLVSIVHYI